MKMHMETTVKPVLSGPRIKRTPSIKRTGAEVPRFISLITGAQPKAGTGLKMQTVRFLNVTLLGIYR